MSDIKFDTKRIGLAIAKIDDDIERSDALLFYDLKELRGKKPIKVMTRRRLVALLEFYLSIGNEPQETNVYYTGIDEMIYPLPVKLSFYEIIEQCTMNRIRVQYGMMIDNTTMRPHDAAIIVEGSHAWLAKAIHWANEDRTITRTWDVWNSTFRNTPNEPRQHIPESTASLLFYPKSKILLDLNQHIPIPLSEMMMKLRNVWGRLLPPSNQPISAADSNSPTSKGYRDIGTNGNT